MAEGVKRAQQDWPALRGAEFLRRWIGRAEGGRFGGTAVDCDFVGSAVAVSVGGRRLVLQLVMFLGVLCHVRR